MLHPQSLEAFAAVQPTAQQTRDRIMAFALTQGIHGLTADELTTAWECSPNHVAPRITELKGARLLVETCRTRLTQAGNPARVLVAKQFATEADSLFADLQPESRHRDDG
jgi:hypothetical protein